jgi:hypothetical protein
MAKLRACPRNEFDDAVLSVSPAMEATMPVTNAQLVARDRVARWPAGDSSSLYTVTGHWNGSGRRLSAFFIFAHQLRGSVVRLKLKRNGATVFDTSDEYVVGELVQFGSLEWGIAPFGLESSEPLGGESPHSRFFSEVDCDAFEIIFASVQGYYPQFGRIYLGRYREMPVNKDLQVGWQTNTEHQRRLGGTLATRAGERWREISVEMLLLSEAERAEWRDFLALCSEKDLAVSVFPGAGGRKERDHVINAKLVQHAPFAWVTADMNRTTIRFGEV